MRYSIALIIEKFGGGARIGGILGTYGTLDGAKSGVVALRKSGENRHLTITWIENGWQQRYPKPGGWF